MNFESLSVFTTRFIFVSLDKAFIARFAVRVDSNAADDIVCYANTQLILII